MKLEKKDDYSLLSSEKEDFKEFYDFFTAEHKNLTENNVIIDLSSKLNVESSDIFLFLQYADIHQQSGTTFVVIYPNVDVDSFPETFNIVPTLVEAEDVLEMENIQRDLGF
ncbi:hypothetical protein [Tenacibaculum jejuense]|uniref:Uncharacterized protein n=1 Tax=Tenacibaculum jejuense TaxID=584609 RepID=A0A238UCZ1_9FLAO|nr:hypothetical protein [Tenacibaculum jejuense]SNR16344.1 conserved protein of unknown function [Tenacibaculum jejuense]